MAVNAFDTAWALSKEWSPDWRDKIDELPFIDEEKDFDFNFNWKDEDKIDANRMQSKFYLPKDIVPFNHPHSERFVAKRPGKGDFREEEPIYRNMMRIRDNPFNVALEELGYPVVSEMHRENDGFWNIQPRLITDKGEHWAKVNSPMSEKRFDGLSDIAARALTGIAQDKHADNVGIDPKGLPRYFDFNLTGGKYDIGADVYDPRTKYGNRSNKERAEEWMGKTHAKGLELPVSRLIDRLPDITDLDLEEYPYWDNELDDIAIDQQNIRDWLELIEPYSRYGTKQVNVDGKAIWGDDW